MKNKPVTIASLDITAHKRYAVDQEMLDPTFIIEPQFIAPHSEITGTSSIYASKWEELFEIHKRSTTWAHFEPPPSYFHQSNRFFSYCLLPNFYVEMSEEKTEEDTSPQSLSEIFADKKLKKISKQELIDLISLNKTSDYANSLSLENDKQIILSLLDSIEIINKMISQVHSKKLQYQKG
ncbi:MAG: hypothetical protein FJZ57_01040 [Chlamydiae bacterium]|nr:hypothetical protein [Chlamydiota bacterium]